LLLVDFIASFMEKQSKIGDNKMKKILCIACLSVLFSLSALADGGMGLGGKTCTNCFANPDTQVEQVKDLPASKSITETANEYFNNITKYFIEIAF
jgi:hypothetical protein